MFVLMDSLTLGICRLFKFTEAILVLCMQPTLFPECYVETKRDCLYSSLIVSKKDAHFQLCDRLWIKLEIIICVGTVQILTDQILHVTI